MEKLVKRYVETIQLTELLYGSEDARKLSFGKWLRSSLGQEIASKFAIEFSNVPLFAQDKNYYFDWGSDEVFNVTKRGKPECSAGLFDMITVDQEAIKESLGKNDYNVIFHASRMLLVTRGLDPQQPSEVFDAFIEHFINTGYVDATFKSLVLQAKQEGEHGNYDGEKARALADAVNGLYANMDDALQFKKSDASLQHNIAETKEREAEAATAEEKRPSEAGFVVTRTKDLRGVLCPMNFVRTKLELSQLQSGDVLEILLDDGKPIENVPGSVRLEGHTVLSEKQLPDGYWQVIIKKK